MTAVDHPTTPTPAPAPQASIWHRLYHGETNFDFVGKRRIGFTISAVLIVVSAISLIYQGLNLGIDFEGGVAWEFLANGQTVDTARSVLEANGIDPADAKIQTLSGSSGERLRVQVDDQPDTVRTAVKEDFAKAKPFAEALPDLAASIRRGRGPNKAPTKQLVSLRLSGKVIEVYKAKGPGWQSRIDQDLRRINKIK